jgi:hypothetical protein
MSTVSIPETNHRRYLGGRAALNMVSESGSGDWHPAAIFYGAGESLSPRYLAGDGCEVNTLELLGAHGIHDCSQTLRKMGLQWQGKSCYAATHERALADLVLSSVRRGGSASNLTVDDLLPRQEEKEKLAEFLALAKPRLTDNQQLRLTSWMARHLQS